MDCPAEPAEPIPAAASTPPDIDVETGPPEQKPQPQPEEAEKMAPETELPSKKIDDESAMPGMLKIATENQKRFHHLKIVAGSQV